MSEEKKAEVEQSFNDDELQDIMNEIESLEQEFSDEEQGSAPVEPQASAQEPVAEEAEPVVEASPEEPVLEEPVVEEPVAEEPVIEEPVMEEEPEVEEEEAAFDEAELESISSELEEEIVEEPSQVHAEELHVVSPSVEPASHSGHPGEVHFEGNGQMSMKLSFDIAGEKAWLSIENGSLKVEVKGVELKLQEDGCHVSMDGGVQFNVPFSGEQGQKKAA